MEVGIFWGISFYFRKIPLNFTESQVQNSAETKYWTEFRKKYWYRYYVIQEMGMGMDLDMNMIININI